MQDVVISENNSFIKNDAFNYNKKESRIWDKKKDQFECSHSSMPNLNTHITKVYIYIFIHMHIP